MLGNKISVLAQSVARAFDLHDDGMVKKSVEQCCCDNRITKNFAPFCKAAIGGEYHGILLVTGIASWKKRLPPPGTTGR